MNSNRVLESQVSSVSLLELQRYLRTIGWIQTERNGQWLTYSKSDNSGHTVQLGLPITSETLDSNRRILDVLGAISQIQSRSLQSVIADVMGYAQDTFHYRIEDVENSDSIPLTTAQQYVKGLKNLYLYSACSEFKPRAYFEQPLLRAKKQLSSHQFGHTFRGSFGFSVHTSVIVENQSDDILGQPPLMRRVSERIAYGLSMLKEAVDKNDPEILISNYKVALNAKMCDALHEMSMGGEARFSCDFMWARSLHVRSDLDELRGVSIGIPEAELLEYASEVLKSVDPKPEFFAGRITNLHCPSNPEIESSKRVVAIKGTHTEHGLIDVQMELGRSRYLKAIEMHKHGSDVVVSGMLERKGSTWWMREIRQFGEADG